MNKGHVEFALFQPVYKESSAPHFPLLFIFLSIKFSPFPLISFFFYFYICFTIIVQLFTGTQTDNCRFLYN